MAERTVFVVNHSGYSYDNAKSYGNIVYLTRGFIDFEKDYDSIIEHIRALINTATPDDYLLLSGNNLLCVVAHDIWREKHGLCNILHWSQAKRNYDCYSI